MYSVYNGICKYFTNSRVYPTWALSLTSICDWLKFFDRHKLRHHCVLRVPHNSFSSIYFFPILTSFTSSLWVYKIAVASVYTQ